MSLVEMGIMGTHLVRETPVMESSLNALGFIREVMQVDEMKLEINAQEEKHKLSLLKFDIKGMGLGLKMLYSQVLKSNLTQSKEKKVMKS